MRERTLASLHGHPGGRDALVPDLLRLQRLPEVPSRRPGVARPGRAEGATAVGTATDYARFAPVAWSGSPRGGRRDGTGRAHLVPPGRVVALGEVGGMAHLATPTSRVWRLCRPSQRLPARRGHIWVVLAVALRFEM